MDIDQTQEKFGLIWIKKVLPFLIGIPERMFGKVHFEKNQQTTKMSRKIAKS